MFGKFVQGVKALGAEPHVYCGSFKPDPTGVANPLKSASRYPVGFDFEVTRSGVGTFSVKVPEGCSIPEQPHAIILTPNPDAAANYFSAEVVGDSTLNGTGRAFTVLTHRAGTALDPTGRINFVINFCNSTGG